ncbi:hypothetical protein KAZ57_01500 [Patescibacteria group bacterium]|nr:hypothetical protein [Patescibacteria group bacterium]
MQLIRRTIVCGACGGKVTLYDQECPYCNAELEPTDDAKHMLPDSSANPHAAQDALAIQSYVDLFERQIQWYPMEIDGLIEVIRALKNHNYRYRMYIIELIQLAMHFRSICLDDNKKTRETHLEIYKRLDAIYISLTYQTP